MIPAILAALPASAGQAARFPPPEFETDYVMPLTATPPVQAVMPWVDIALLALALGVAVWLVLRRRSRRTVFLLMCASILYFGFVRRGCVCPVGSLQNVVLALTDTGYAIPWVVLAFFLLPLVAAVLFGRVFCAAVCPLGGVQDMLALKPVRLPVWLNECLQLLAYLYLGLAVLYVVMGAGFVVCRFDPYVTLFRMSGNLTVVVLLAVMLVIGAFVARPYCRFLCPYGVLLRWASRLSWKHAAITPDTCVVCRLCERSCPFDAILPATGERAPEHRRQAGRRLGLWLAMTPLIVLIGGFLGHDAAPLLARLDPAVRLLDRVRWESSTGREATSPESEAFHASAKPVKELYRTVNLTVLRYRLGGTLLGLFMGLVVGGKLVRLSMWRHREGYEPDRGACLSCARCFAYCPHEQRNRASDAGTNHDRRSS